MIALYALLALLALVVLANLVLGRLPAPPVDAGGIVETAGGPIHYLEHVAQGRPIVFIHGMPGISREFDAVRAQLTDLHTVAFDRPGYSWSTGAPQDFGTQLDAIVEAAGTLGIDRAVVVGHSFGGLATLGLAIRHPDFVERMLLLAPAAGGTRLEEPRIRQARLIMRIERPGVRQVCDLLFLRLLRKVAARQGSVAAYGPDPEFERQRALAVSMLARHNSIRALANDRLIFNDAERLVTRNLGRIVAPSIILHGREDPTVIVRNGRRLAEALPETELIETDGDHQLPAKSVDDVVAALRSLLAR